MTSNFTPAPASSSRLRGLEDASTKMFSSLEITSLPPNQNLRASLSQVAEHNAITDAHYDDNEGQLLPIGNSGQEATLRRCRHLRFCKLFSENYLHSPMQLPFRNSSEDAAQIAWFTNSHKTFKKNDLNVITTRLASILAWHCGCMHINGGLKKAFQLLWAECVCLPRM